MDINKKIYEVHCIMPNGHKTINGYCYECLVWMRKQYSYSSFIVKDTNKDGLMCKRCKQPSLKYNKVKDTPHIDKSDIE